MIAGNDLGTDTQSYLYCSAYGNGTFIVRGMGPAPFAASARKPEPNAAIAKAAGKGSPVKQDIAVTVTADKIECAVNGAVVGSYDKADLVAAGKLKSTDGVYGIRFAHNTEATVTNRKDEEVTSCRWLGRRYQQTRALLTRLQSPSPSRQIDKTPRSIGGSASGLLF